MNPRVTASEAALGYRITYLIEKLVLGANGILLVLAYFMIFQ